MNLNQIFNQVVSGLANSAQGNNAAQNNGGASNGLADKLGGLANMFGGSTVNKVGGGAAVLGLISMVLGKNGGANLAKMGSLAVLGNMAYQAFQQYQANKGGSAENVAQAFQAPLTETNGSVLLQAMIAAAMADGELDANERQAILSEAGSEPELQQWIEQEIQSPASPEQLAQAVNGNAALASQVYLAAQMVCGDVSRKEMIFLAQLAEALGLEESLVEQLEKQMQA